MMTLSAVPDIAKNKLLVPGIQMESCLEFMVLP